MAASSRSTDKGDAVPEGRAAAEMEVPFLFSAGQQTSILWPNDFVPGIAEFLCPALRVRENFR